MQFIYHGIMGHGHNKILYKIYMHLYNVNGNKEGKMWTDAKEE